MSPRKLARGRVLCASAPSRASASRPIRVTPPHASCRRRRGSGSGMYSRQPTIGDPGHASEGNHGGGTPEVPSKYRPRHGRSGHRACPGHACSQPGRARRAERVGRTRPIIEAEITDETIRRQTRRSAQLAARAAQRLWPPSPVHSVGRVKVRVEAPLLRGGTKLVSVSSDKLRSRKHAASDADAPGQHTTTLPATIQSNRREPA